MTMIISGLTNRRRAGRREPFYYFEDNAGDDHGNGDSDAVDNDDGDDN